MAYYSKNGQKLIKMAYTTEYFKKLSRNNNIDKNHISKLFFRLGEKYFV